MFFLVSAIQHLNKGSLTNLFTKLMSFKFEKLVKREFGYIVAMPGGTHGKSLVICSSIFPFNSLMPKRTQVSYLTEISILF